jgi:uncharacterized protein YcfJ
MLYFSRDAEWRQALLGCTAVVWAVSRGDCKVSKGRVLVLLLGVAAVACERALTPMEKAAKDRSECSVVAIDQSGFDPVTAEEPPRTISSTHQRGGEVVGSGAVVEGAAKGAVVGVVGGAIMGSAGKGAAAGAAVGGLMGGARRHRETKEMVTSTRPNPEYTKYSAAKTAYKNGLEQCLTARARAPE